MAYKQFSTLQTEALTQIDELVGSGAANARTLVKLGINEGYAEMAGLKDWKLLENSTTLTTTAGTMEYTPITHSASTPRIRRIQAVIDQTNNRFLGEIRREEFEQQYPYVDTSSSANQGEPLVWYQSGFASTRDIKIKLFPVPDDTVTIQVVYTEEPAELVADTDVPRIPDQYHYTLVYRGVAKYFEFWKDPMAPYYRGLFAESKRSILEAEFDVTDEMPSIQPLGPARAVVQGKIGRVYN